MPPSIFISLRFGEALEQGRLLQAALAGRGLDVYLCSVLPGINIAVDVSRNLVNSKLVVILGTATYGLQTASSYSTHTELLYVMENRKPFFLVKMCDDFRVPETHFYLNSTVAYYQWTGPARTAVPADLVDQIIARLRAVDPTAIPSGADTQVCLLFHRLTV